jgi:hypothetical protein
MGKNRTPLSRGVSASPREVKTTASKPSDKDTPMFCFRFADRRTQNSWAFRPSPQDAQTMLEHIAEIGAMEWRRIKQMKDGNGRARHHFHNVAEIAKDAQDDLAKAQLDKRFGGEIFRFGMGSTRRLWGFVDERTFHVVFWENDHSVYPTAKGGDKSRLKERRRRKTAKKNAK